MKLRSGNIIKGNDTFSDRKKYEKRHNLNKIIIKIHKIKKQQNERVKT